MHKVIGISGLIGSGKDTIADYLVRTHGYERMSFADTVKDMVSAVFGWDREMLEGKTLESRMLREEKDVFWSDKLGKLWTPRIALQEVGTELFRGKFHSDIWVNAAEKKMEGKDRVVFSDVRFPNEMQMIKRLGALWRVRRGLTPKWYSYAEYYNGGDGFATSIPNPSDKFGVHESEWAHAGGPFDHVFRNDWSLQDLYNEVDKVLEFD